MHEFLLLKNGLVGRKNCDQRLGILAINMQERKENTESGPASARLHNNRLKRLIVELFLHEFRTVAIHDGEDLSERNEQFHSSERVLKHRSGTDNRTVLLCTCDAIQFRDEWLETYALSTGQNKPPAM